MGEKFTIDEPLGTGELSPGATPRRWEPEQGVRKLNEKIHRESKYMDNHGNLPFTFSKPKKGAKPKVVRCLSCGALSCANKNTVGIVCSKCNKYSAVEAVEYDS